MGVSSGKVESQYFVGSFSPSGHSMRSHSSGWGALLNKLEHFRAIATRDDKLAKTFLAGVQLASVIVLLN